LQHFREEKFSFVLPFITELSTGLPGFPVPPPPLRQHWGRVSGIGSGPPTPEIRNFMSTEPRLRRPDLPWSAPAGEKKQRVRGLLPPRRTPLAVNTVGSTLRVAWGANAATHAITPGPPPTPTNDKRLHPSPGGFKRQHTETTNYRGRRPHCESTITANGSLPNK